MNVEQSTSESTFNSRNPHGLGDPNDTSLRRVEIDVLIPKIMRDRTKELHCSSEVKAFEACCKEKGVLMVVSCRNENSCLKDCLSKWYSNEAFKEECKQIYLQERSEYRRTGIARKHRMARM